MKPKNIQEAKDPDLRASAAAMSRAAEAARKTAIQTGTEPDRFERRQAHPNSRRGAARGDPTRRAPAVMTETNQKQVRNTLWSIADQLRGALKPALKCGMALN